MRATILLCVLLTLLAGCGDTGGEQAGEAEPPVPTRPPMEPAGSEVRGELGGDAELEGGCAWVTTEDGTRYEVLFPEGYTVEFDPLRLLGPDGAVIAEEGDRIEVLGEVADDVASTCQVGVIWRAESVEAMPAGAG